MALVLSFAASCQPAFSDLAPAQKVEAAVSIFPNNGRRGQSLTVIALPAVGSPEAGERVHVVELGFGDGIEAVRVITNSGAGCTDGRVVDLLRLLGETRADRFPVCIEIEIAEDAPVGDSELVLELVADGNSVISIATFSVLPALVEGG